MPTEAFLDIIREDESLLGQFAVTFMLSPPLLSPIGSKLPALVWDWVPYGREQASKVPNDKRGVYAFVIATADTSVPTHGYVCYIGIAGRKSNRSLRARYGDYLNEKAIAKRRHIAHLIGKWHQVLKFYFAPVNDDVTSEDLQLIERNLNDAFMPPFSRKDFSATIGGKRKAFRG